MKEQFTTSWCLTRVGPADGFAVPARWQPLATAGKPADAECRLKLLRKSPSLDRGANTVGNKLSRTELNWTLVLSTTRYCRSTLQRSARLQTLTFESHTLKPILTFASVCVER